MIGGKGFIELNDTVCKLKQGDAFLHVPFEFTCNAISFSNRRRKEKIDAIIELLPMMQKNSHLPFVLEEWANQAGLTPNYFCSLFKKVTKMTPLAYITKSPAM
ncbi:AraC family transcriptional regulator [Cohnella sp. CFH 77786]|nr:AraC family transcriptional regulator [Cohnella sp. CFH 77786]